MEKKTPFYKKNGFKRFMATINGIAWFMTIIPHETTRIIGMGTIAITTGYMFKAGFQDAKDKKNNGADTSDHVFTTLSPIFNKIKNKQFRDSLIKIFKLAIEVIKQIIKR